MRAPRGAVPNRRAISRVGIGIQVPHRKAERWDRSGARRGLVNPCDIIPEWWARSSGITARSGGVFRRLRSRFAIRAWLCSPTIKIGIRIASWRNVPEGAIVASSILLPRERAAGAEEVVELARGLRNDQLAQRSRVAFSAWMVRGGGRIPPSSRWWQTEASWQAPCQGRR
jgi:hypothetical protein